MTVATLRDLLQPAVAGRYAVAGLVVQGWEDALAYTQAAEEAGLPVILQAGPGARRHTPVSVLGKIFRHLAEHARVPVACHIDHAVTLEECLAGIGEGFTSVMIDGSSLTLGQNIALTCRVAEAARAAGVSVEGEVGFVGYAGGRASAVTQPADAALFERETGVDALAISVGNVHLQTEATEGIDLAALQAIAAVTRVPLVLHGGSGISPETRRRLARQHRVAKFNIGTELRQAFGAALRRELAGHPGRFDRIEILSATIPAQRAAAAEAIRNLGPGSSDSPL
ncbi:MAG: class II fructose-bisphosphate aldolase [Aestuariivirga sp.]|uniref:class II fructose-bisphosphate aldolase n=1 Tax=Aestuariivirga sp. TaxID=2650926 RepID=UPI0025B7B9DB|nr:class II fructose-bisphosphate aldolase [Aestuariivirga sp.]MCA3562087.1 class II fructose-bisphosphate aldolase [Aestuariivirga sp.]